MKITKKNGNTTLYDDDKLAGSILRANREAEEETLPENTAYRIADEVFSRLTEENEVITTAEIRACVYAVLYEKGFPQTAERYITYSKQA